jgi:paraquat-inducible protein A
LRAFLPKAAAKTLAYSLAALALYFPANRLPITLLNFKGEVIDYRLWDGCVGLWRMRNEWIAGLLFYLAIFTPLVQILSLSALALLTGSRRARRLRMWLYRLAETTYDWNMLEIFLLAIFVSITALSDLALARPGPGAPAYAAMTIFVMLAARSFDPRLLWEEESAP